MNKTAADLILTYGYVITMDTERRIITDGAVAIQNGKIAAVGKTADILNSYTGEQFDCKGGVVHPGLIDAHEHIGQHLTRGWEPDTFSVYDTWTKFECLEFPNLEPAIEKAGVKLCTLEMAKNGTTCFSDTGSLFYIDETIDDAACVGIRGIVASIGGDLFQPELSFLSDSTENLIRKTEENLKKYGKQTGRKVRTGVQLCGMGDCSDEMIREYKKIARRESDTLYMHQCVYKSEFDAYMEKYGKSPVEHLADLGILDEKTALVHMIRVTDEDVRILADTRTGVVHCPAASLKFALGSSSVGKFPEMADAGIEIALGTDSGTWSDGMDVFKLIYLAATIHKEARRELLSINSYKAFEMATIGGARVLGMEEEIGSLETGKCADIVIHGTDLPECHSPFDPFTNLVYAAGAKSVKHVLVDGEWIVKDGRAVLVDEEQVLREADETAEYFRKKTGYQLYTPWKVI